MSAGPARLYSREAPADGARQPGTLREPAAGSSISALPTRPGGGGHTGDFGGPLPAFPSGSSAPSSLRSAWPTPPCCQRSTFRPEVWDPSEPRDGRFTPPSFSPS